MSRARATACAYGPAAANSSANVLYVSNGSGTIFSVTPAGTGSTFANTFGGVDRKR
jgi:hypothetical protein